MTDDEIVRRAFEAFSRDTEEPPPLSLRGADAVDSYDEAAGFDAVHDEPTDAYIEQFAFWGLRYLTHDRGATTCRGSWATRSGTPTTPRWSWKR